MSDDEQQNYDDYKEDLKTLVRSAAQDALHEPIDGGISLPSRITALESVMTERNRVAESNGKWLAGVAVAVTLQIIFSLFSAGTKYQMIDDIKNRLAELRAAFDAHQASDLVYREVQSQKFQTLRSDLEKEIYQKEK